MCDSSNINGGTISLPHVDPAAAAAFPEGNPVIYDLFIRILTEQLQENNPTATQYDAVLLTVPDAKFTWCDLRNDHVSHFLLCSRVEIESAESHLLYTVTRTADRLLDRAEHSVNLVYTYRDFEYVKKMFAHIVGTTTPRETYEKMLKFLKVLAGSNTLSNICCQASLTEFLYDCPSFNELEVWEQYEALENLAICFHKMICAVILLSAGRPLPDGFEVRPQTMLLPSEFWEEYNSLRTSIYRFFGREKLALFQRLYDLICNSSDEVVNRAANDFISDFFPFVNSTEIQDEILFNPENEHYEYVKIFNMYHLFYKHIKYSLYRTNRNIGNDGVGLMRNSLTDREVVLKYLAACKNDIYSEIIFNRLKQDGTVGKFAIRLARENDKANLILLSSPKPPYRRAIYIAFDEYELTEAIEKQQIWIIEDVKDSGRVLACAAIILYNDKDTHYDSFCAGEMNDNYRKKYFGNNTNFKYIDYDSVLVNDGRSNFGEESYRGYGFQRLTMILAEELAKIKECDYICATVSTFNAPSQRNFALNGYRFEQNEKYTFTEPSPFYQYITSDEASIEERERNKVDISHEMAVYGEVLERLGINEDDYTTETVSPRDFVVLDIKRRN